MGGEYGGGEGGGDRGPGMAGRMRNKLAGPRMPAVPRRGQTAAPHQHLGEINRSIEKMSLGETQGGRAVR